MLGIGWGWGEAGSEAKGKGQLVLSQAEVRMIPGNGSQQTQEKSGALVAGQAF